MKCYACEQLGIDREATGICIVCGMGLCTMVALGTENPWNRLFQLLGREGVSPFAHGHIGTNHVHVLNGDE